MKSAWSTAALVLYVAVGASGAVTPDMATRQARTYTAQSDARRGWHFYEDPTAEAPAPKVAPAQRPTVDAIPALIKFKQLQKELEERRAIAIIEPTEANVTRYMELEAKVLKGASIFADVAQRIAWRTPGLDPTTQGRPVSSSALDVFDQLQAKHRDEVLAALGTDHVLMFFFRSDCPYCHAYAPVLKAFGSRYRIQVHAVSLDGGPLPEFPKFRRDNGIARTLNVTQVPAVFLAQPFTGEIVPLGAGVLSDSQLTERVLSVAAPANTAPLSWADQ